MYLHWLILITGIFTLFQAAIYRWFALKQLHYTRAFDRRACFEGDEIQLVERITNRKLLPLPWLRLESLMEADLQFQQQSDNLSINSGSNLQNHKSIFSLMPYTIITRRHQVTCLKRGCYILHTATLSCGDLLGLRSIHRTYKFGQENRLLVYPRPVPMREIPLPSHSWLGELEVRRWMIEDPFSIAGVREYRYGDPLNILNWKATARSGKLQVHNRNYTADHRLLLWIDCDPYKLSSAQVNQDRMELAIRYTISLAEYAISRGIETGFGSNGHLVDSSDATVRIGSEGGHSHLLGLYETLAMLKTDSRVTFEEFLDHEIKLGIANCDIVLFTQSVTPRVEYMLHKMKSEDIAIQIVMLQDEPDNYGPWNLSSGRVAL